MNHRRHAGRHFLRSPAVAKKMADAAGIRPQDNVLEIGTGRCAITPLLGGKNVATYETDLQMYEDAVKSLKTFSHIRAVYGDGFKSQEHFDVFVSSLPYSQSRRAIEWLVQKKFSRAVIMVQEEFAQKLEAASGKQRKAVSILACGAFEIKRVLSVTRDSFDPPPKVKSTVLVLKHRRVIPLKTVRAVNRLFSYRRKTVSGIPGLSHHKPGTRLDDLSCNEIIEAADIAK